MAWFSTAWHSTEILFSRASLERSPAAHNMAQHSMAQRVMRNVMSSTSAAHTLLGVHSLQWGTVSSKCADQSQALDAPECPCLRPGACHPCRMVAAPAPHDCWPPNLPHMYSPPLAVQLCLVSGASARGRGSG